jgi:hypothetical protein
MSLGISFILIVWGPVSKLWLKHRPTHVIQERGEGEISITSMDACHNVMAIMHWCNVNITPWSTIGINEGYFLVSSKNQKSRNYQNFWNSWIRKLNQEPKTRCTSQFLMSLLGQRMISIYWCLIYPGCNYILLLNFSAFFVTPCGCWCLSMVHLPL